jgi:glycyl-tRNA synthetase (class II)
MEEQENVKKENLQFHDHEPEKRAHYAKDATDIEYKAPWGWAEFMGMWSGSRPR